MSTTGWYDLGSEALITRRALLALTRVSTFVTPIQLGFVTP